MSHQLPAGLEFPGDDIAQPLPDGGWIVPANSGHLGVSPIPRGMTRLPRFEPSIDAGPDEDGDPTRWYATHKAGDWFVACGISVVAVWRLPNGGRP